MNGQKQNSKCACDWWLELQVKSWSKTWKLREKKAGLKAKFSRLCPLREGRRAQVGEGVYLRGWTEFRGGLGALFTGDKARQGVEMGVS